MLGKVLKIKIAVVFIFVLFFTTTNTKSALAGCSCEDWDKDGRYGIVYRSGSSKGTVLAPNQGTYNTCLDKRRKHSSCRQSRNACTCEDWDEDGRFGIVLYKGVGKATVKKANVGNYYNCNKKKRKTRGC